MPEDGIAEVVSLVGLLVLLLAEPVFVSLAEAMDPVALVEEVLDAASLDPVSVETIKLKLLEPLPVNELGLEVVPVLEAEFAAETPASEVEALDAVPLELESGILDDALVVSVVSAEGEALVDEADSEDAAVPCCRRLSCWPSDSRNACACILKCTSSMRCGTRRPRRAAVCVALCVRWGMCSTPWE